jgi:hypothetical protein
MILSKAPPFLTILLMTALPVSPYVEMVVIQPIIAIAENEAKLKIPAIINIFHLIAAGNSP